MGSTATYIAAWKIKKSAMLGFLADSTVFNHPHQLQTVSLSGSVSFVIDDRPGSEDESLSWTTYEADADYSLVTSWSRVILSKVPATASPALGVGEFTLVHQAGEPWYGYGTHGDSPDAVTIGTFTSKYWTRATPEDPWVLDSSATSDIVVQWGPPEIGAGGLAPSWGKGPGGSEEDCSMFISFDTTIADIPSIDLYPIFAETGITRSPYTDPWASETAAFAATFSDWLAATSGATGSCTLSLDFS